MYSKTACPFPEIYSILLHEKVKQQKHFLSELRISASSFEYHGAGGVKWLQIRQVI